MAGIGVDTGGFFQQGFSNKQDTLRAASQRDTQLGQQQQQIDITDKENTRKVVESRIKDTIKQAQTLKHQAVNLREQGKNDAADQIEAAIPEMFGSIDNLNSQLQGIGIEPITVDRDAALVGIQGDLAKARQAGKAAAAGAVAGQEEIAASGLTPAQAAAAGGPAVAKPEKQEFTTDIGKAFADAELAKELFGEDSEQFKAIQESAQAAQRGEKPKLNDVTTIRKEFRTASASFGNQVESFRKLDSALKEGSGAGDLAAVFTFMKALDPTSVVREGEQGQVQKTGGAADSLVSFANRMLSGEKFTGGVREDLLGTARNLVRAGAQEQVQREQFFTDLAVRANADPRDIVVDEFGGLREELLSQDPEGVITATGPNGEKLILQNGQWVAQ